MKTITVISIDLREFYPIVEREVKKYAYLSFREIHHNGWQPLYDAMISALFFIKRNVDIVVGKNRFSHLLLYYTLEEFIDIYDDLQIAFRLFLESKGIMANKRYNVMRCDNFRTVFIDNEEIL